jgi:hypothetical protein
MEKSTQPYTKTEEMKVVNVLESIHGDGGHGEIKNRCYIVLSFAETEEGLAGTIGMFGNEDFSARKLDMVRDAHATVNMGLSSIAARIASDTIQSGLLESATSTAIGVQRGAANFLNLPREMQEKAQREVVEELMEREFAEMKA